MKLSLLFFLGLSLISNSGAKEIVMQHMVDGDKCVLCHEAANPKQLFLRDGTKIEAVQVDTLCRQCHGVKYRNWLIGRHGKLVNSWKTELAKRVSCIECHNPHTPKFPKYEAKEPPHIRNFH